VADAAGKAPGSHALVGREDLAVLAPALGARSCGAKGQFVRIGGEPGIGKSRLIEEFRAFGLARPRTPDRMEFVAALQNTPQIHPERSRALRGLAAPERRLAEVD
jgi:hypothetical protein